MNGEIDACIDSFILPLIKFYFVIFPLHPHEDSLFDCFIMGIDKSKLS